MVNKVKSNTSFKDNPITSIIGGILMLVSLILLIVPYFYELKKEVEWDVVLWTGGIGILLFFSPDSVFNFLKRKSKEV